VDSFMPELRLSLHPPEQQIARDCMPNDFQLNAANTVPESRAVYTPSRLNQQARALLERNFAVLWVEGEISNLSRPGSGHWYFSLKDATAQLRCAMFRQRNLLAGFQPADGMLVQVRGRVSLYEPRGDYQFLVDHIEQAGEGALRRRFELLKARLAAEGCFDPARKRPLPRLPRRIGLITSPTGAALRDLLQILRRRCCAIPVLIYPVQVQGAPAAIQIAAAIRCASARAECDVLVLARGGGSLEDLWAFNEEVVARAIHACSIPVVSGIGHETDFTIADFVADVRAPTPSAAAELIAPDGAEWLRTTQALQRRLIALLRRDLQRRREKLRWLNGRLAQLHPGVQLRQHAQRLDELEQRLVRATRRALTERHSQLGRRVAQLRQQSPVVHLSHARHRLLTTSASLVSALNTQLESPRRRFAIAAGKLATVSPLATLQRGYAIVSNGHGHVVTDAGTLAPGDLIQARVAKGSLLARIERTED
jgi:exodeoxyribonuclease VII large subunit